MTAPLAGNVLPEDRMIPRERELCRDDLNHDFLSGVYNRRYFETEFCPRLDHWTERGPPLRLAGAGGAGQGRAAAGRAGRRRDESAGLLCGEPVEKALRPPGRAGGLPP